MFGKDSSAINVGLTDKQVQEVSTVDETLVQIGHDVAERHKQEKFRDALKAHWRGGLWSIILSTALIMEGYDTALINSLYGVTQFAQRFGVQTNGKWAIPASDQTALGNLATVGQLIGLIITGYTQERFGMKKTYIAGMIFMAGTIFVAVFATNLGMLMAAEILMGMPWGMFQTLTTAYAAEICPLSMRGYLAAYASIGWGAGKFIATGVLKGILNVDGDWAWRLPFAIQWVWPLLLTSFAFLAPESPWWLTRHGRFEEAERVLVRISPKGAYHEGEPRAFVEYMKHTDALDRAEQAGGNWSDMFRGTNLRRTEIQFGVWMVQNWNGSAIYGQAVVFLQAAGLSTADAFNINIILQAFGIIGVIISWVLLRYFGRRPIYLWGILASVVPNLIIGILGFVSTSPVAFRSIGGLMILINLTFHMSIGPVCYTVVAEIPSSRLRARSIAVGRFVYAVNGIIVGTLLPYMNSTTAWNWNAKAGLFWCGTGLLCFIWAYFRLPETRGFTFAEIDILFSNRVPARKFGRAVVRDEKRPMDSEKSVENADEKVVCDDVALPHIAGSQVQSTRS